MEKAKILDIAKGYIDVDRQSTYGSPQRNLGATRDLWVSYLNERDNGSEDLELTAEDVAVMMVLLKIGRIATGGRKLDNYVDACGYMAIAGELSESE